MPSSFTNLLHHVVFSTKERRPLIDGTLADELYPYIGGIIRNERGVLLEIGGMPDHLHILARFRADASVADMVRLIKTNSSKWANERSVFAWQTGYGAFSVSKSQVEGLRGYTANQAQHHEKRDFKNEFMELLRRHEIEFDERYLWG